MSFLDTVKKSILEIAEENKRGNHEFAEDLMDILLKWLDEELSERSNYTVVHAAISDIHEHLGVLAANFRLQSSAYYNEITNDDLKDALIKFYAAYLRAISFSDYPLACKCVFQQIESLVSYLLFKRNVINKIVSNINLKNRYEGELSKALGSKFELAQKSKGGYLIPLFVKLWLVSDEFKKEFTSIKPNKYLDIRTFSYTKRESYDRCYKLRNYDSHGVRFGSNDASIIELEEFKKGATAYLQVPIELIGYLTTIVQLVQDE